MELPTTTEILAHAIVYGITFWIAGPIFILAIYDDWNYRAVVFALHALALATLIGVGIILALDWAMRYLS